MRIRLRFVVLLAIVAMPGSWVSAKRPLPVTFSHEFSAVDGHDVQVNWREQWRIEHFLRAVFPVRDMRRSARAVFGRNLPYWPISQTVKYTIIEQEGYHFVLVNYRSGWDPNSLQSSQMSTLAIYRVEADGPNQVWRSRPWHVSYPDFHFLTAKSGPRNVIFFQEGGTERNFGLASVFSFQNASNSLVLHDLTPSIPWLRAMARFPFRPLYGQEISLRLSDSHDLLLRANDEEFDQGMSHIVRPGRSWIFNRSRGRFERAEEFTDASKTNGGR